MAIPVLLRGHGIRFKLHEHPPASSLEERTALGYPMERTVKTLAFGERGGDRVLLAALVTGDRLEYHLFAAACATSRARLAPLEPTALVERLGVESGGVPPLPLSPRVEVVLDERVVSAAQSIFTGAGRADRTLELAAGELTRLSGVTVAAIARKSD